MSFFAINLKKLRTAKKLSQQKFAELFEMTRSTVGAYEEGRAEPKLDKIIEIAGYFKLSVDQLISKPLTISDIFHLDKKINQNKITKKRMIKIPVNKRVKKHNSNQNNNKSKRTKRIKISMKIKKMIQNLNKIKKALKLNKKR